MARRFLLPPTVLLLTAVSVAGAQIRFPLGNASITGRIYDSVTQAPIVRARVCQEYAVPIYGRASRCADVDTLGRYTFDSLVIGVNTITVDCAGRDLFGGKRVRLMTVTLDAGERRHVDFPTTASGCDPRPFRLVHGIFRGHYSAGFEESSFTACPDDVWFLPSDTVGMRSVERHAWVNWPRTGRTPGSPETWPSTDTSKVIVGPLRYYVRWEGVVAGPGHYGHLGVAGFNLTVDSIIEVKVPAPNDCGF